MWSDGLRLVTTSVYLSIVGLFSTLGSLWVLSDNVRGQALLWVTWLSVLGAIVAVPIAAFVVTRCGHIELERRR